MSILDHRPNVLPETATFTCNYFDACFTCTLPEMDMLADQESLARTLGREVREDKVPVFHIQKEKTWLDTCLTALHLKKAATPTTNVTDGVIFELQRNRKVPVAQEQAQQVSEPEAIAVSDSYLDQETRKKIAENIKGPSTLSVSAPILRSLVEQRALLHIDGHPYTPDEVSCLIDNIKHSGQTSRSVNGGLATPRS